MMSSYGNELSKWNLKVRGSEEFQEAETSPSYANKLSSETPIGGMDQCLHIPGKADSAYSSFSGGSNIPECHIPLGYNDHDTLPLEQLPYMDSGYVRGVFNPCVMHSNLKHICQDKPIEMSMHNNMDNNRSYGSISIPGTLYQPPSPVAKLPPPPPPPPPPHSPSPPDWADSSKARRNTDQSHYGICFDYSIQTEKCMQETNKILPSDSPADCYDDCWLSRYKNKNKAIGLEDTWYPANQYTTKKKDSTISTTSSLNFQDYLKSDSSVHTQKIHNSDHNYNIPEAMNSKSFPSPHTSHNAVNDTQENKQYLYACSVHKPPFTETDLPCTMSVSGKQQLCGVLKADEHSGLNQGIYESWPSLKYTDSSLPSLSALAKIKTYEDKNHCFSSGEENSRNVGQPLLKQQPRRQKAPSHGLDMAEIHHSEVCDTANTISYCKHYEDSASQIFNGFRRAKQNEINGSHDVPAKPKQEEMLTSKKAESLSQDDFADRKINRKTTPLLYYLSGGRNTNIMSDPNQAQLQEDFDMRSPRSDHLVSAEPIPTGSNNCINEAATSQNTGLILGSPASSADEKFKHDYREKLKVAQRKVLRETSFKRKDLQMSLPIRLKQEPSSRPSIQHLRSLSLSSTNEDSKLIPPSKPLENISKEEEPQRPQTSRIGGRKRITKEQKKISYSEPEKLNQLDDQRDHSMACRKKNARSRSDEFSEQDTMIISNKALENQGRALSKVELKQIQHNALLQYMERKTGQRPATAHTSALQKPPVQMRPSFLEKFAEDSISNSSSGKKSQNIDSSCPFLDLESNLEVPPLVCSTASIAPASNRGSVSSSMSEKVNWTMQSTVSEGSCAGRCASTKSFLYSGASVSSKGHGRSKSTPSPMQDFYTSTAYPALSSQNHKYYHILPSAPSAEELEANPSDSFGTAKQNTQMAGRRGKSMEETGSAEMVRLSPLSQSTDQLHYLKSWHTSSGLKPDENSQRPNHQNSILQNCEPTSGLLPRQLHPEGVAGLKGSNPTVHALGQPPGTTKHKSTFISLGNPSMCRIPALSVGRLQSQSVPLEPLHPSSAPSPVETDNDVFKESFTSGSEKASTLPFPCRQSKNSVTDRTVPEPALTVSVLQTSMEGKQIKEYNASFYVTKKAESSLGNRLENSEENISAENSQCPEMAPECSAFVLKERINKDSQPKKERSSQSQMSSASGRIQQQQLQVTHTTGYCSEDMTYCTTISDSQGDKNTDHQLANVEQTEHDHIFQEQDTAMSTALLKSREDQRCEDLAVEIVAEDKSPVDILRPHPIRKTTLDLMEGLFPVNISMSDRSFRIKRRNQSVQENDQRNGDSAPDLSHETGYFLGQRVEDPTLLINQILSNSRECLKDPENITFKKRELISKIQLQLQTLRDEKELIQSETKEYAAHGKELESLVQDLCKHNEYERYMMFIGDLEKVVSLLLCLSSRLARVQNAMGKIDENTDAEEKSLNERHSLLSRQREDAKELKENLDRRERVVSGILSKYLTESQLQDYRHFIQAKAALLIEQKDLEEQIKFLEEQLERLEQSIPP
ncbi:protein Shroom1 isoform X2 [Eublepharis macularius]|uniref:Protein Shroom1 isoform X2 n=1 Tax=Eublepharis macularius TaxID=481883 RepID=A0AA97J757_EUBMA|nr:protein Shroom1 isoform X2 [Eublepharis macularius]